jgi:hypothetical protein
MRVLSAAVALAVGMAFFAVCLGTCLAATGEHACCEKGQGFTVLSASTDCCHVTSGVRSKLTTSMAQATVTTWIPQSSRAPLPVPPVVAAVPAASSPPLVLRI